MAEINKAIVIRGIHTNLINPSTGQSENYKEVSFWYDNSPMIDDKVDGELYRKKEDKFLRKVIDKEGELFLEKDTMEEMRNISSKEILYLKAGIYKGVTLNGYYEKGDTPNPINYYLSDIQEEDDGGGIINIKDLKLRHNFLQEIDVRYYGLFSNSSTEYIQSTINKLKGKSIKFSQSSYNINGGYNNNLGLIVPANTSIITSLNTIFYILPSDNAKYVGFTFNSSNYYVNRLVVKGERNSHIGTTGEWGIGINFIECKNFRADYLQCDDCYGDGVYFGKSQEGNYSEDIIIEELRADNNRRQGVSFITGKSIIINKLYITNTNGVPPSAGIDFEPNHDSDVLQNIQINNLYSKNNSLCGVLLDFQKLNNTSQPVYININDHFSVNERALRTLSNNVTQVAGKILYNNLVSVDAPMMGIEIRNYYNMPDIEINNPTIINPNKSEREDYYGSGIMIYRDTGDTPLEDSYYPFIEINNAKCIDNREVKLMFHGIVCQSYYSNGTFMRNVKVNNPIISGSLNAPLSIMSNLDIQDDFNSSIKYLTDNESFHHRTNNYKKYSNKNAKSKISFNLLRTHDSIVREFLVESAEDFNININDGTIVGISINQLTSNQIGAKISIQCIDFNNNIWRIVEGVGIWQLSEDRKLYFDRVIDSTPTIPGIARKANFVDYASSENASDLDSTMILVNELKRVLNDKIAADINAGQQSDK